MASDRSERGHKASFDRSSGAVHGSGSGAGGNGNPDEDYDRDPQAGSGHPLPASGEARHGEIPEHAERDKGRGDDPEPVLQPADEAVAPDGHRYPYADLGRGPGSGQGGKGDMTANRRDDGKAQKRQLHTGRQDESAELERDQAEHQDRGQKVAAAESDRD